MSDVLQPGVQIKPVLSVAEAKNLVESIFGICVVKIKELDAYDDKNYFIEVFALSIFIQNYVCTVFSYRNRCISKMG